MSLLANYEKQEKQSGNYLKLNKDEPVILQLLEVPLFLYKDLAFENNGEKLEKVIENYIEYNPKIKPQVTQRLDLLDILTKKTRTYKHVWACIVYNHTAQQVQYFEFSQMSLIDSLIALDSEYDLLDTPLKITKTGEKVDTKISAVPLTASKYPLPNDLAETLSNLKPNLKNLLINKPVFGTDGDTKDTNINDNTNTETLPSIEKALETLSF